jgi:hypothetical protein
LRGERGARQLGVRAAPPVALVAMTRDDAEPPEQDVPVLDVRPDILVSESRDRNL